MNAFMSPVLRPLTISRFSASTTATGVALGATTLWEQINGTLVVVLAAGGLAGALGGAVVALMFDFLAVRVHGWLAARLDAAKQSRELPPG